MDEMKLKKMLDSHAKWLRSEPGGERANLSGANLRYANLSGANLHWANFSRADLRGADLRRADGLPAPVVPGIDRAILGAIGAGGGSLYMASWHKCDTTHCRAGWAVVLAGKAGRKLEREIGTNVAGALIYAASRPGMPVPNWYASDEDAMDDIRKCAEGVS